MKTFIITCMTILFVCSGCGDICYHLTKITGKKNTFELKGIFGRVDLVQVCEVQDKNVENPNYPDPVWRISNKRWLDSLPFRITVPEIPEGFIQDLPKPPEQFKLCTGKLYMIEVFYSSGPTCPGFFQWVAE